MDIRQPALIFPTS